MTTTGGVGAHEWQVSGTLEASYFWLCRCGEGSDLPYRSEQAAASAASDHVRAQTRR
ncbi:hypothetical protein LQ327_20750 [Actinomycetospora endophytica]|uniref:Uncharacterized protein n=1 Tax=Actinomycetospora endophytica TaxID=2291215 RepID=A0ABS8PBZ5_9PSEU|nr:hypothetical protein [Actinomycetospora endophytica]MCD2195805.1 hypothetical protein [Actinomycetospora endophytica]